METREKYIAALGEMATRRTFSVHDLCRRHHVSCTVGTIVKQLGWIAHPRGSRKWSWVGPKPLSAAEVDAFMSFVSEYKKATRVAAPSMAPGARQERRERTEKYQGRRTDRISPKREEKTFSLFWGLVKFSY